MFMFFTPVDKMGSRVESYPVLKSVFLFDTVDLNPLKNRYFRNAAECQCFSTCPRLILYNTVANIHNTSYHYKMVALYVLYWWYFRWRCGKGRGYS